MSKHAEWWPFHMTMRLDPDYKNLLWTKLPKWKYQAKGSSHSLCLFNMIPQIKWILVLRQIKHNNGTLDQYVLNSGSNSQFFIILINVISLCKSLVRYYKKKETTTQKIT